MKYLASVMFVIINLLTMCDAGLTYAISRFKQPKYPEGFTAFAYVNPNAPKGGVLKMGTIGTFETLNKDSIKGFPVEGLMMTVDPLMKASPDDPYALYALVAEKVEVTDDYSSVTFYINPKARFHDGTAITAEDVVFTVNLLKEKGKPAYRNAYAPIEKMEILSPLVVRFTFSKKETGYDRELPLIIARLRVLSKKALEGVDFQNTGLKPIMGSGPYRVGAVDPGRSITYERVKDYWAADLPVNRGQYNFDSIVIDYYKNAQAQFQAFKAGEFDCFFEADQAQWHGGYNCSAVKDGRIKQVAMTHNRPVSVRTFIFNLKKEKFQNPLIREALVWAFDFESVNKMYFYDVYKRMTSLFANTHFVSTAGPTKAERALMIDVKGLPKNAFEEPFTLPVSAGNGNNREALQRASALLDQAGWLLKNGQRVHAKTGEPLVVEFIIKDQRMEKVILAYKKNLAHIGVTLNVRFVDNTQYEKRTTEKDFDMIAHTWTNSLSPGIEQVYYFSAEAAQMPGSSNYIGVTDPVYEKLAWRIVQANTEEELVTAVRVLDRVVMYSYLMVPIFYDPGIYFSYWADRLECPPFNSDVGTNVLEWWWRKVA